MATGGFVAVLVIDLHFPDAGSLKGKRKELSSLKAQLRQRLGVAVGKREPCPCPRQRPRNTQPDAIGAAGDECGASFGPGHAAMPTEGAASRIACVRAATRSAMTRSVWT